MKQNLSPQIFVDELGVALNGSEERPGRIDWNALVVILGYKKDCFSVDQIRVELMDRDGSVMVLTEEDLGFSEFREQLAERVPVPADWWEQVFALPTFGTSVITLLDRRKNSHY
jgi:hypothetical protein